MNLVVITPLLFCLLLNIGQTSQQDPLKDLERLVLSEDTRQLNVKSDYDRFEDRTRYWTFALPVSRGGRIDHSLKLSSFFHFRGKGAGHSIERLGFVFFSTSSEFRFVKYSQLYAIVDGQRLDLGSPVSNERDVQGTQVAETLVFAVSFKTLRSIAEAKQIEMRLGSTEFELTESNVSDLKELLAKIQVVKVKK